MLYIFVGHFINAQYVMFQEVLVKSMEAQAAYRQKIIMISMGFIIVLQLLSLIWQHVYFTAILTSQKDFCSRPNPQPDKHSFFDSDL